MISEDVFGDGQIVYPKREYLTDEEKKPKPGKGMKTDDNPAPNKRPRLDPDSVNISTCERIFQTYKLENTKNEEHVIICF